MKLTDMFSAMRKYLKFYDRGIFKSGTIAVQGKQVSLFMDTDKHTLLFISELSASAGYEKRIDVTENNRTNLAEISSSSLKEYLETFGTDISPEPCSLPCYSTDNAFTVTGSRLHSFISAILKIKDSSENKFTEYLFLDSPNKDTHIRLQYCNSVSVAISDINTNCKTGVDFAAIDVYSLEILKSMIRKQASYKISFDKSSIYCRSDKEAFCYQLKDDVAYTRCQSVIKLIENIEQDTKGYSTMPVRFETMNIFMSICKSTSKTSTYKEMSERAVTLEPEKGYILSSNQIGERVELAEISKKGKEGKISSSSFDSRRLYHLLQFILSDLKAGSSYIKFMTNSYHSKYSVRLLKASVIGDQGTRTFYLAPIIL